MTVQKSFFIFLAIVIISIIGILFWSIDASTFAMLKNADPRLLSCAGCLVVLGWILDGCKFFSLARASGEKLSLKSTMAVVWINYFGCAITPMQSGGGPFQIFMLYREGICVGKSIAITLVRTLQTIILLGFFVPFALVADPELLQKYSYMRCYLYYVVIFVAICSFVLIASVIRPQWIKRGVNVLLIWGKRIGILKSRYLMNAVRRVSREIDAYNANIKLFSSKGKYWLITSIFFAVLHLLVYMSIMPCLAKAAGFNVDYLQFMLAEALLLFMLYFVPTPGASGVAEGGAAAVFALFVPWSAAGVMAVAWRVLSEYTGIALGTIIIVKMLGWGGANEVMTAEHTAIENIKEPDDEG